MRRVLWSVLIVCGLMSGDAVADPPPGYQLVWAEEFNGTTADLDKNWEFQNGPSTHILCSRWRENVVVADGVCRLLNHRETKAGQEWTSGSMYSKREFKYGYFECRYKYGAATGLNNSFWLMTRGKERPEVPVRFEIDVNEGHFPNQIATNIHKWSGQHTSKSKSFRPGPSDPASQLDLSREFHVYGLLWTEKDLVFYFEGQELRREPNEFCHGEAPVWLSSAIIKWAGPVTEKIDGTSQDIDWVRVYQRNP